MTDKIEANVPAVDEGAELDLTIEELDDISAGLRISTLACVACPYSSFSSLSD